MPTIVMEGWRFLPHSYSLWAMYLCLELQKRPGTTVYFLDAPMADAKWRAERGVLNEAQERQIAAIAPPPPGLVADLQVRLGFPYDFSPTGAKQTVVLGTTEYGIVPSTFMKGGEPVGQATARSGFRIGTPTKWSMDGFLRSGVKAKQVFLAPNGIDPEIFRPASDEARAAIRREMGWEGKFVLFHSSSLGWNKNVDEILHGLYHLAITVPQAHLVIKGMDALYQSAAVMERVRSMREPDMVERVLSRLTYIGESMSMERVARLYQGADAYVCPYLAEGFNMPALEAAACGIPVVCTAGGSTDDFVTDAFALKIASKVTIHKETGGKALLPNTENYISQLRRVVKDDAYRANARVAGPAHAHAGWTWAHAAGKLLAATGLGST